MRLKPVEKWAATNDAVEKVRRYTDDPELRNIIADVLLAYTIDACNLNEGNFLIRGATEFVNRFLTLGDPKVTPKQPEYHLH